jgi:hypothetical protein
MGTELQTVDRRPRPPGIRVRPKTGRASHSTPRRGLIALGLILFDECPEEFQRFSDGLAGALSPKDRMEELLVERIVACAWRLRRIYRIETGLFAKARTSFQNGKRARTRDIELVFLRLTANDDVLAKLTRYEASLERSLDQAMRELRCRQFSCRGSVGLETVTRRNTEEGRRSP